MSVILYGSIDMMHHLVWLPVSQIPLFQFFRFHHSLMRILIVEFQIPTAGSDVYFEILKDQQYLGSMVN